MASFIVDEDLPRSLARELRAAGQDAVDVRDVGLRGCPDTEVFAFAVREGRALLTADLGFGNTAQFPPRLHSGIIIARFSNETPVATVNRALLSAIVATANEGLHGCTLIVEPGRLRLRRWQ